MFSVVQAGNVVFFFGDILHQLRLLAVLEAHLKYSVIGKRYSVIFSSFLMVIKF